MTASHAAALRLLAESPEGKADFAKAAILRIAAIDTEPRQTI